MHCVRVGLVNALEEGVNDEPGKILAVQGELENDAPEGS